MTNGFNVQGVELEGFKGFTVPKQIDFKGRHVFLLGQNGNGKSSIIEAVRWGLFGSAFRPNEVIKNQHYPGECRVTLQLIRAGEPWTLRRTLNLGAGSSSEAILTDQHGIRKPIREIMPQLDSVDAGEGTHIIFAPQSAPLRRQPEDLDPFEKTVFNYLGLTHPRVLLSHITESVDDQNTTEHHLDEQISKARKNIDEQIEEVQSRRNRILSVPPWGAGPTPSIGASEQKARAFIEEITNDQLSEELEGLSLNALVETARTLLHQRSAQAHSDLTEEATEISNLRGTFEDLRGHQSRAQTLTSAVEEVRNKLHTVLNGRTPDALQGELKDAKRQADNETLRRQIARDAANLIERDDSEPFSCPICNSKCNGQTLLLALQSDANGSDAAAQARVRSLETRLQQSHELQQEVDEQESDLRLANKAIAELTNQINSVNNSSILDLDGISQTIDELVKKEEQVTEMINNQDQWHASKLKQLHGLQEEADYHNIQKQFTDLQKDRREFERITTSYGNLILFGESIRSIRDVVKTKLNEQLKQDIPRVSNILSGAFSALTQHPWYDRLVITEASLPKLELRVASSKDSSGQEDPTGVLNGQAESALNLVPYFAFSQTDDTPTEVYLVMLDDPTRASDTIHIQILVERLRELGQSVQLIVASQETERLGEMIPEVFDPESYIIVEPTGWSPESGPNLEIRYE